MRLIKGLRIVLAIMCLGLLMQLTTVGVLAATGTGTQNPDLTVTVSLPDNAHAGHVSGSYSVHNNTTTTLSPVAITTTVQYPTGYSVSYTQSLSLSALETYAASVSLTITGTDPKGVYSLTVTAGDANPIGPSSATATVTVS
jgi:hypothetical protein